MGTNKHPTPIDLAIVGAGAAGLATAIFAGRGSPDMSIVILDGAKKIGAKILVSGGGRCNVTNSTVTPADFHSNNPHAIKRILTALPVDQTVAFFRQIGVELKEEEHGKLFPTTDQAKTVLDALLAEAQRCGVKILTDRRVTAITRADDHFDVHTPDTTWHAHRLVLATGGKSLPKTGSDGVGFDFAQALGHSLVPTTPALVPLVLADDFHKPLSGIAQDVELTLQSAGAKPIRITGAMLWTHFGISGPVVLDASRHWHRARLEKRQVSLTANFLPGSDFTSTQNQLLESTSTRPKTLLRHTLAQWIPARIADAILQHLHIDRTTALAHLAKEQRRKIILSLLAWPLPVRDSRGYTYAEVTAGGIPLTEIDPKTMASRKCPNLYLVGEILDIDGRIGGFNFQWAWSSAHVAAQAIIS